MTESSRHVAAAAIVAAGISATGSVLAANWDYFFPPPDPSQQLAAEAPEELAVEDPEELAVEESPEDSTTVDDPTVEDPEELAAETVARRRFGTWSGRSINTVYPAETDGFVAVYTHTDNPGDGVLLQSGGDAGSLETITRVGRWQGAVLPVAEGDYWRVTTTRSGRIRVNWMPVELDSDTSIAPAR